MPSKEQFSRYFNDLKSYFNVSADLEPQADTEASIRSGVSFKGSQLLILVFAIFVASLGLNTDNVAVIIGAMLISPLMGPIIGMGLGIGISDYVLLQRGLKNILMAVLGSIVASAVYFLISPQYEDGSQLLARTSPSIYDVFIALFGGGAGIVSLACKNKGQVLPGVAIATSLMPPLCTAGYGLATLQPHFFFGALYLFFTNMVFILFATWIGVKMMRFKPVVQKDEKKARRVQTVVTAIVTVTIGLSAYLTVNMIRSNIFMVNATQFVNKEMVFPNTQVLSHKEYMKDGRRYIDVTLIGEALPKDSLQLAMLHKLDSVGLGGTILTIKQGFSLGAAADDDKSVSQLYTVMQQEILQRQNRIDSLESVLALRSDFSDESSKLAPEVKVLFPQIKDIALSNMVLAGVSSSRNDTVNMVFVKADGGLTEEQRRKLVEYVGVRLHRDDVHVSVNPHLFPWPEQGDAVEEK
ncbi:TIGR00341 family protein [Muribaculaceae bacterium Isolate-002 (NCI)]|nr:TIGR00341 family protein [Muribaculaceae bacterium Isolate-002 (NCI)]